MRKARSGLRNGVVTLLSLLVIGSLSGTARADVQRVGVDCDKGETIADALRLDSPLVVVIQGTCNEHVLVANNDVTLLAGPGGATVNGPTPNTSAITVTGQGVVINGLRVTGGRSGIVGSGADRLTVRSCLVENTGRNGIVFFHGANGTVDGCLVQNNARDGVVLDLGASVFIVNSTITANTRRGILVGSGSGARIGINAVNQFAPNTISNNGSDGIGVLFSSNASIGGNTITGNGTDTSAASPGQFGIQVFESATAQLAGGNTVTANAGSGVLVSGSGSVDIGNPFFGLPTANTISGNGTNPAVFFRDGVTAFRGSSLLIRGGANVSGNFGNGVTVSLRATAQIFNASITNNNTGDGIRLQLGGALLFNPPLTITGNNGFGLQCLGTEASFAGDPALIGANNAGSVSPGCTGF